jgi:hypothetical protein
VATEIEFAWVGHAPPMRSPQSTPEITPRARTLTYCGAIFFVERGPLRKPSREEIQIGDR